VRPILRSTAVASLVSVVAEPSRDVGAGCGGPSEVVSMRRGTVRISDWKDRSVERFVAHLYSELWEGHLSSSSKSVVQLLQEAPPQRVLMCSLVLGQL
jgi:hypothetical protein